MRPNDSLRGKVAIVGTGLSPSGEVPGFTRYELMAQAVERAMADAGVTKGEIDGVFAVVDRAQLPVTAVCEYLGIRPKVMEGSMIGGSSFVHFLQWAALSLQAGLCDVALIAYGSNARSGGVMPGTSAPIPYETAYGARLPTAYALAAQRHMHEYGTTPEQLAEVAVAARSWAAHNPAAMMRGPLTIDDVLSARRVSDPLGVRDCCLITDGGGAVILTRADRVSRHPKPPAYLLGVAAETSHQHIAQMEDLTVTAAVRSGARALEMAGASLSEIDFVQLYDAFTINTILFLEDLGFCKKGEGGAFVSGGRIGFGGSLPVNTNGGGLSCVHPGMYGVFTLIEAVAQLRGECAERQVPGARLGLAHGNGGSLSTQVTAVLGTAQTL